MKALKYDTNVTVKTFREILPLKEYKVFPTQGYIFKRTNGRLSEDSVVGLYSFPTKRI